jgi:hypothetical protein
LTAAPLTEKTKLNNVDKQEVKEAAGQNQTLHTLKCHPTPDVEAEPGTIPMECQDVASSIQPIIVVISSEGLDLVTSSLRLAVL